MVEQWTENPCVPGSIPGGTTKTRIAIFGFFVFNTFGNLNSNFLNPNCNNLPQSHTKKKRKGSQNHKLNFSNLCVNLSDPCG